MTNSDKKELVVFFCNAVSIINMVLAAKGKSLMPIENEQIELVVAVVCQVAATGFAMWKNFNFTKAAKEGQLVTNAIKSGTLSDADIVDKLKALESEGDK